MLGSPGLDTAVQLKPHEGRVERHNPLSRPTSHPSVDAVQDAVGLVGYKHALLALVKIFIHQNPQVLLCRAALNELSTQSVLISEIALTQVQHLALGFTESY